MKKQNYNDIVTDELLKGTLDHNAHTGFLEDYRVISCLLKLHKPKTMFEIGTNIGSGINVMAKAVPGLKIYSLDLDYDTMMQNSKQYPIGPNGEDRVGSGAKVPYTQLRGDSLQFDYRKYPCDAYFIDGEHDYIHAHHESRRALEQKPKLIIWHDADMDEVYTGIVDAFVNDQEAKNYSIYRVEGTRIAYAIRH